MDTYSDTTDKGAQPTTDDVSLCLYCGDLAAFVVDGENVSLRPFTEEELAEHMKNQDIINALAIRQLVIDKEVING